MWRESMKLKKEEKKSGRAYVAMNAGAVTATSMSGKRENGKKWGKGKKGIH